MEKEALETVKSILESRGISQDPSLPLQGSKTYGIATCVEYNYTKDFRKRLYTSIAESIELTLKEYGGMLKELGCTHNNEKKHRIDLYFYIHTYDPVTQAVVLDAKL